MIGEFDFDDMFHSPDFTVPGATWVIFIVFLIIMTLILMNLLVSSSVYFSVDVLQPAVRTYENDRAKTRGEAGKAFPPCF